MRALALALRMLLREWRSGELGVLVLAITVAVAALTGVGFLVDRIGIAVDNQAGEVLAADLRLESGQQIDDKASDEARRRGLEVARQTASSAWFSMATSTSSPRCAPSRTNIRCAAR